MANVLERIVADKRETVAQLKAKLPLTEFIDQLQPTKKDLYAALKRSENKPEAGFILECKKASPSKGLIRPDFDVLAISSIYDKYAAGISVLTDEKYFQGTYEYLQAVTATVNCAVLNKDFFIDTYQVYLARHYGADAILLMLSVLTDEEYQSLAEVAEQYSLAILTEVSNEEELERAIALDAKLIGINNRNLRDLSTDIATTFALAPKIPDDRIVISESGIYTNAQVRELAPAVDGFLVGSSIMAQDDIDLACRNLVFGHNKVCGLTNAEQAQQVIEAGAYYGGLIFAEKSPRAINVETAKRIIEQAPALNYVGVFVNAPIAQVAKTAEQLSLSAVQLHGEEDADYVAELKQQLAPSCTVWKAKAVTDQVPALNDDVDQFVLDNKQAGSGKAFDWQRIVDSEELLTHCLLAGGLCADNISLAIDIVQQQDLLGLDINSGVESAPGQKCPDKIAHLFSLIRNY